MNGNDILRAMSDIGGDAVESASENNTREWFAAARRRRIRLATLAVAACLVLIVIPAAILLGGKAGEENTDGEVGTKPPEIADYAGDSAENNELSAYGETLAASVKVGSGNFSGSNEIPVKLDINYTGGGFVKVTLNPGASLTASLYIYGDGTAKSDTSSESESADGNLIITYPSSADSKTDLSTEISLIPVSGGGNDGALSGVITLEVTYYTDRTGGGDTTATCTLTIPYTVNNGTVTITAEN